LGTSNDALGDPLSNIVLSAVWPALASPFKRQFHRSHRSAVKLFNDHCRTSANRNGSTDEPLVTELKFTRK
jgi:hypothetical protein